MRTIGNAIARSLVCIAFTLPYCDAWANEISLFVMAGQSNMVGFRSNAAEYPQQAGDDQIPFYWNEPGVSSSQGAWTTLQPQAGFFPRGHFGPEVTFARTVMLVSPKPAVFKYSLGSSSLSRDWRAPGAGGLYDDMIAQLSTATALQHLLGNTAKVRALIWIQGESDGETAVMAKAYESNLRRIIDDFRDKIAHDPKLPIVLGVDEQHPWVKNQPIIAEAQSRIAAKDNCVIATSMVGLPKADSSHLTAQGVIEHGKILARAWAKLQQQCVTLRK